MFNKIKQLFAGFSVLLVLAGLVLVPSTPAFAQNSDRIPKVCTGDCPLVGNADDVNGSRQNISDIIINIARFITFIAVALAVVFMVWGGIQFITAGSADGSKAGKERLINATIGLVIAIVAYTIVQIIANVASGNALEGIGSSS